MKRNQATKRLSSGKYIDLSSLKVEDVDINDIDKSLNLIHRFTGHWKDNKPLTVAQHTRLVVHLSKIVFPGDVLTELDCTIHDFPEAYTGDIATPLKKLFGQQFKDYENEIEDTVYAALYDPVAGLSLDKEIYEKRKVCDLLALDIERRSIWKDKTSKTHWPDIPMDTILSTKEKYALYNWAAEPEHVSLVALYNDAVNKVAKGMGVYE